MREENLHSRPRLLCGSRTAGEKIIGRNRTPGGDHDLFDVLEARATKAAPIPANKVLETHSRLTRKRCVGDLMFSKPFIQRHADTVTALVTYSQQ